MFPWIVAGVFALVGLAVAAGERGASDDVPGPDASGSGDGKGRAPAPKVGGRRKVTSHQEAFESGRKAAFAERDAADAARSAEEVRIAKAVDARLKSIPMPKANASGGDGGAA